MNRIRPTLLLLIGALTLVVVASAHAQLPPKRGTTQPNPGGNPPPASKL